MLKPSRSHQDYFAFVRRQVAQVSEPAHHLPAKAKLLLLDLTLAISIRALLYATDGRPAIPQTPDCPPLPAPCFRESSNQQAFHEGSPAAHLPLACR
jgi:hypothetical protein